MLSIQSLCINEDPDCVTNYNQMKIDEFKNGIEICNKQVYVNLVWHDNVDLLIILFFLYVNIYGRKLDNNVLMVVVVVV